MTVKWLRARTTSLLLIGGGITIVVCSINSHKSDAGKWRNPFRKQTNVERLAGEIDDLEEHIEQYGSVVAKHPSIWGEARLTKHRHEFEQQIKKELQTFELTINARIDRKDRAFFEQTIAIQQAAAAASSSGGGSSSISLFNITSTSQPQANPTVTGYATIKNACGSV